jgi:hypothetical protein
MLVVSVAVFEQVEATVPDDCVAVLTHIQTSHIIDLLPVGVTAATATVEGQRPVPRSAGLIRIDDDKPSFIRLFVEPA